MNSIRFNTIASTNDYAREHMDDLEHGTIVRADSQSAGRGQPGKMWVTLPGENIYMSLVLKPGSRSTLMPAEVSRLVTRAAEVVVAISLELYGLESTIKPPNDVYINGKKVAGILVEAVTRGDELRGVIVGIGLNCNSTDFPGELKNTATSLQLEYGQKVDVEVCFNKLATSLRDGYKS